MRNFFYLLILAVLAFSQSFAQCTDTVGANYSPNPACSGRNINLTATTNAGGTVAYSWTSVPATYAINNANTQNPTVINPNSTGGGTPALFIVTVTAGPCTYKDTASIIIEQTPQKPIVTSNSPVCSGDSIFLCGASTLGLGISYEWYGPNGYTHSDPNNCVSIYSATTFNAGTYCNYVVATASGCTSDTTCTNVQVAPQVDAAYTYSLSEGCGQDTIRFTNLSQNNTVNIWTFGDGTPNSSLASPPPHVYVNPTGVATFTAKLFVSDGGKCSDSAFQTITIDHPIDANFTVSNDSFCQGETIQFDASTTIVRQTRRSYYWDFGDGLTDTILNPLHQYPNTGEYDVVFVARDSTIRCFVGDLDSIPGLDTLFWSDTARFKIVVDSISFIYLDVSDTVVCAGQSITLTGDYSAIGNTGFKWTFGDNNTRTDLNPIDHAYGTPGTYTIRLDAFYRICPDTFIEQQVVVKPYPTVNLGPDTSICVEGAPIPLIDANNAANPAATWLWNTGDTTSSILVKAPGVYAATVIVDGCAETDSVTVRKNCYIDIPNVFSPDGDGHNDYFLPRQFLSKNVSSFSMQVFNRWGQQIFDTKSINGRGWDGKMNGEPQPTGVYIYVIDVTFGNGARESYKGNVTLIR